MKSLGPPPEVSHGIFGAQRFGAPEGCQMDVDLRRGFKIAVKWYLCGSKRLSNGTLGAPRGHQTESFQMVWGIVSNDSGNGFKWFQMGLRVVSKWFQMVSNDYGGGVTSI